MVYMTSIEFLEEFISLCSDDVVIIASSGRNCRDLYYVGDRDGNFYMVGAMGGASAFGLGIVLADQNRKVVVVDGDGSALMKLGNMVTIGNMCNIKNLTHIIINNKRYLSTGGQPCQCVDFKTFAFSCGYLRSFNLFGLGYSTKIFDQLWYTGASLINAHVTSSKKYARPAISLFDNYERFKEFLRRK